MFNSEDGFNGGPEYGIYYLKRIFDIIINLFKKLFGGNIFGSDEPESEV